MSSNAIPISPARFAAALTDLPLSSLYAKAAELDNSISHLQKSNTQLLPFAQDGDSDCRQALEENQEVIERMEDRIHLLKLEVQKRGQVWHELRADVKNGQADEDMGMSGGPRVNGNLSAQERGNDGLNGNVGAPERSIETGGFSISMRRDRQDDEDEEDNGIHL